MRVLLSAAGIVAYIALTVYSVVDALITEPHRVRLVHKGVWVVLIVLLPIVGAVLWHFIGKTKPESATAKSGYGPEDDPAFLRKLDDQMVDDEKLRQLEEELRKLNEEDDGKPQSGN